ncbi:MAG: c-type cytochrome domain-containing protein, partial [Planctomycetaceae bacterium]
MISLRPKFRRLMLIASILAAPLVSNVTANSSTDDYQTQIRPYLAKYCFECHGPKQQKADLRLDTLDPDLVS